MRRSNGGQAAIRNNRSLLSALAAACLVGAVAAGTAGVRADAGAVTPAPGGAAPSPVPAPAEVVRETGSWFAHGYTLDLLSDGTGTFAVWIGAFDGNRIGLRLTPAPGDAVVAEVTGIETVGGGALSADELPGTGGLVTVAVGAPVRTAHVEWSPGPRRLAVDLCPADGLDAATMAALRCGA